jgi:hypothetical protein
MREIKMNEAFHAASIFSVELSGRYLVGSRDRALSMTK